MRSAILTKDGFEIDDMPTPTIGDDDVLIQTIACGVCSGDVFVYQNRAEMSATYSRLGHEASGKVVAVGPSVTTLQLGDTVTSLASPAYADYFVDKAAHLVKLPPTIDPKFALGEAVACCVHAGNRFGIQPGDSVAVVGCGFMGLVCLQLAKYQGADFICAIDPLAERREMGHRFGADVSYHPDEMDSAAMLAAHSEFDVVIEAAGSQSAVDLCSDLVKEHGRIILVGYHQSNQGMRTVKMQQWNYKAIDVVNGHVRRLGEKVAAMAQGMALMQAGHIQTEPMVTLYNFADIEQAFQNLAGGTTGLFKAILQMETS
ncbi:MAG: zinc-binding dehydrogenase [Anaerolineales bacterium]|nr:zinc-binding dehydrogenase [Anaerolineales bacterium]MCB9004617.1 zinc-binding dehydrogenase [Ardenticatenaceae bacterium]